MRDQGSVDSSRGERGMYGLEGSGGMHGLEGSEGMHGLEGVGEVGRFRKGWKGGSGSSHV
jgi:hypothetical protein